MTRIICIVLVLLIFNRCEKLSRDEIILVPKREYPKDIPKWLKNEIHRIKYDQMERDNLFLYGSCCATVNEYLIQNQRIFIIYFPWGIWNVYSESGEKTCCYYQEEYLELKNCESYNTIAGATCPDIGLVNDFDFKKAFKRKIWSQTYRDGT